MGLSAKLLGPGEHVVLRLRTHAKAMVLPAVAFVLLGGVLGVGAALVPTAYRPIGQYVVVLAACALGLWWSVIPFLRWRSRTYTITNYRLVTRQGILAKTGTSLPLARIVDVSYERSLMDRMLRCGTLNIQTAAEGALVLDDVPDVEHVHQALTELLFEAPPREQPKPVETGTRRPSWARKQPTARSVPWG
jgi:uncharacterized membrane protein YdbT with pleckstrin-like domain